MISIPIQSFTILSSYLVYRLLLLLPLHFLLLQQWRRQVSQPNLLPLPHLEVHLHRCPAFVFTQCPLLFQTCTDFYLSLHVAVLWGNLLNLTFCVIVLDLSSMLGGGTFWNFIQLDLNRARHTLTYQVTIQKRVKKKEFNLSVSPL